MGYKSQTFALLSFKSQKMGNKANKPSWTVDVSTLSKRSLWSNLWSSTSIKKIHFYEANHSKSGKPEMQIISKDNRVRISLELNQKPKIIQQRFNRGQRVSCWLQGNTLILCQTYNGRWRKGRFPLPGTFNETGWFRDKDPDPELMAILSATRIKVLSPDLGSVLSPSLSVSASLTCGQYPPVRHWSRRRFSFLPGVDRSASVLA